MLAISKPIRNVSLFLCLPIPCVLGFFCFQDEVKLLSLLRFAQEGTNKGIIALSPKFASA